MQDKEIIELISVIGCASAMFIFTYFLLKLVKHYCNKNRRMIKKCIAKDLNAQEIFGAPAKIKVKSSKDQEAKIVTKRSNTTKHSKYFDIKEDIQYSNSKKESDNNLDVAENHINNLVLVDESNRFDRSHPSINEQALRMNSLTQDLSSSQFDTNNSHNVTMDFGGGIIQLKYSHNKLK